MVSNYDCTVFLIELSVLFKVLYLIFILKSLKSLKCAKFFKIIFATTPYSMYYIINCNGSLIHVSK